MAIAAVSSFLWTPWYTMVYMPKPLGYPRIVLPAHTYTPLSGHFPYTFAVSSHAVVKPAVATHADKYWINIYYPTFDATIHLTTNLYKITLASYVSTATMPINSLLSTKFGHLLSRRKLLKRLKVTWW